MCTTFCGVPANIITELILGIENKPKNQSIAPITMLHKIKMIAIDLSILVPVPEAALAIAKTIKPGFKK